MCVYHLPVVFIYLFIIIIIKLGPTTAVVKCDIESSL